MYARSVLAAAMLAGVLPPALAGEQYIDKSGFAAGGYDVVAYHRLEQAPLGEPQPGAVPGRASITAQYNGATWAFASEANREAFLAAPARYAPAFDGHCAFGVSKGGKVPGNPNLWRIVDGTLYLNIVPDVVTFFEQDIEGNITRAEENWQTLESVSATSKSWRALPENRDTYSIEAPLRD